MTVPRQMVHVRRSDHWCLDEDVHLLADVHRQLGLVEAVDNLQYACIDSFCCLASKGHLRDYVWLEAHEVERRFKRRIATDEGDCQCAGSEPPCVVFIDVNANMEIGCVLAD